ncbi:hypothetical protein C8Q80DRAFT_1122102 [Daedaleopsis nitida]|nr:hypothetical protein C8Q80DRAFT_1122102 [Daedaleopsis nitida]
MLRSLRCPNRPQLSSAPLHHPRTKSIPLKGSSIVLLTAPTSVLKLDEHIDPPKRFHRRWYVLLVGKKVGIWKNWAQMSQYALGMQHAVHQSTNSREEAEELYYGAKQCGEVYYLSELRQRKCTFGTLVVATDTERLVGGIQTRERHTCTGRKMHWRAVSADLGQSNKVVVQSDSAHTKYWLWLSSAGVRSLLLFAPPTCAALRPAGQQSTGTSSRSKKKARFKSIDVPPSNSSGPASAAVGSLADSNSSSTPQVITRDIDHISVSTSRKGHGIYRTNTHKVYLMLQDLFLTASDMNIPEDVDQIMHELSLADAEELEPETTTRQKQKRDRADLRAATKVREWLPLRQQTLEELLLYKGSDEDLEQNPVCSTCLEGRTATVRCVECVGRSLHCAACVVGQHHHLPLHRLQVWNSKTFIRTSLQDLGLEVQLGHNGKMCPNPSHSPRWIVVRDVSSFHEVAVRFCECIDPTTRTMKAEWIQLFRQGWYPATNNRPATAFTFCLLETYQELNFQAKTSLYDYC